MTKTLTGIMAVVVAVLLSTSAVAVEAQKATNNEVPRITKEDLKAMLGSPDVIILDVRLEDQWKVADRKLPGAVHEDPAKDVTSWVHKYPKEKTIVLY